MSEYLAPLKDMQFVLQEIAPMSALASVPDFAEVNLDLATAILEEAGKFASGVLSPLNVVGDRECQAVVRGADAALAIDDDQL
jgi:3-(methylthio)propanoyl-CoA dehydrogenase